ncbi:hypothetical protein H0X06_00255 [Candidatus Dependentiae bacterium]|nr:hypothetical protein [Candidatus Dependentiae bacterium]
MKYSLMFTLLISAPLAAVPYQEARAKLDSAQGRVDECKSKVENLKHRVEDSHKITQELAGKSEYSDDMESRKKHVHSNIEQHNKAVQELEQAITNLKSALSEIGRQYKLVESGEKYSIMEPDEKELDPIVNKPQPSYERRKSPYRAV